VARTVRPEQLDLSPSAALAVVSSARKFILPVPALPGGGDALVYPDGHPEAGKPVNRHGGLPEGARGVLFWNAKDACWQAVLGDGSEVVVVNQVDDDDAAAIRGLLFRHDRASAAGLRAALRGIAEGLGLGDVYNSTRAFVAAKMSPCGPLDAEGAGLHKRDDRDLCWAVRLAGDGLFEGPGATPQVFSGGAAVVRQGDSLRLVQRDVFLATYVRADGAGAPAWEELPPQGGDGAPAGSAIARFAPRAPAAPRKPAVTSATATQIPAD